MRLPNAVTLLLLILSSLTPYARASRVKKPAASQGRMPSAFAIEVLGANTEAQLDGLAREIAADSGSCAWSIVKDGPHSQRLYIGLFSQSVIAKEYGDRLIGLGLIRAFRVTPTYNLSAFSRSRTVLDCRQVPTAPLVAAMLPEIDAPGSSEAIDGGAPADPDLDLDADKQWNSAAPMSSGAEPILPLLLEHATSEVTSPALLETPAMPQPNPAARAIYELTGCLTNGNTGGLWLSGDVDNALNRLRWILGQRDSDLITVDSEGRVTIDLSLLCRTAGVDAPDGPEGWLKVAEYIFANEGLLLVAQLAASHRRYCFHIGDSAPTAAGSVAIEGTLNLDNRFDSRINPHRKRGSKVPAELPPAGFDALVAMNPEARWFNLSAKEMVAVGEISFHELAEARAKVDLGLEYLPAGPFPGAHDIALERERRLRSQRPQAVTTAGQNIVFRSRKELEKLIETRNMTGMQ